MHAAVLRYFDHVARQGSIRRAAEALNVASSAVNRQILKLEEEIGTPLFERLRSGVRLTSAGEALLRHARGTLADFERTRLEIAGLSGTVTGHVRIICLESLILRFMPRVVEELVLAHPQLTLTVVGIDPGDAAEEMRSGRNDFGVLFMDRRMRGVDATIGLATSIGAVMRPDHPLAARKTLTLTDCARYPIAMLHDRWLLDLIMATEFAESGEQLSPRIVSNSIDFMRQIVEKGLGIGFFTPIGFIDEIERGELVHVALSEPLLAESAIAILVPRGREPTLPARIAMEAVRKGLAELAARLAALGSVKAGARARKSRSRL
jgi:DNA-binding transcriptional LysR family regulator